MEKKILTLVIPSYNISRYVDECIDSYIDKSLFPFINVVFIDDGATDDTLQKLKPYLEMYPDYFSFFHKENGGHGSVINFALDKCIKTKYFKVIDGDDWVITANLYELAIFLSESDYDVVLSDYILSDTKNNKLFKTLRGKSGPFSLENNLNMQFSIHSLTFKTAVFVLNKIHLPEKVFYEDNIYSTVPFKYAKSFYYIDKPVYVYRINNSDQSISISSMIRHFKDLVTVTDLLFEEYNTLHSNVFLKVLQNKLTSCLRQQFLLLLQKNQTKKDFKKSAFNFREKYFRNNKQLERELKKNCRAYKYSCFFHFNFHSLFKKICLKRF